MYSFEHKWLLALRCTFYHLTEVERNTFTFILIAVYWFTIKKLTCVLLNVQYNIPI